MPRPSEMNQDGDVRESIESRAATATYAWRAGMRSGARPFTRHSCGQATSRVSALSISDGERVSKLGSSWADRASVFAGAGVEGLQGGSLDHTLLNLLKGVS